MSYTALYRKFRPQTFDDVKGQDHIVTTLKNQVASGRTSHAYLFCGTRGTGKTTIAKILAKLVNCENPTPSGPCCKCDSCKAIADGTSMNVIEIDAASNNGVDNIREIIEEVSYSPVGGKYKVYIIDEVHMLSPGAFNALLKTLEEPPSYAMFILATTDVHKIPITILSRCQRYDFKRIGIDTISARMRELADIEGLKVEDKALKYIAKMGDGSMRDSLSLLDQCVAFNFGSELTYDKAIDILGSVDNSVFSNLLELIIRDDIIGAVNLLEEIVMQGRELVQFVTDFTWYLRNLMLVKSCDDGYIEDVLEVSSEHLERLREEAKQIEINTIFRYIDIFSELSSRIKYASQKRIIIEMTLIRLCRPQMDTGSEDVLERVRQLEKKVENGITVTAVAPATSGGQVPQQEKKKPMLSPEAISASLADLALHWPSISSMVEAPLTGTYLKGSKASVGENNVFFICVPEEFQANHLREPGRMADISALLDEHMGGEHVDFEIKTFDKTRRFNEQYVDIDAIKDLIPGLTVTTE